MFNDIQSHFIQSNVKHRLVSNFLTAIYCSFDQSASPDEDIFSAAHSSGIEDPFASNDMVDLGSCSFESNEEDCIGSSQKNDQHTALSESVLPAANDSSLEDPSTSNEVVDPVSGFVKSVMKDCIGSSPNKDQHTVLSESVPPAADDSSLDDPSASHEVVDLLSSFVKSVIKDCVGSLPDCFSFQSDIAQPSVQTIGDDKSLVEKSTDSMLVTPTRCGGANPISVSL